MRANEYRKPKTKWNKNHFQKTFWSNWSVIYRIKYNEQTEHDGKLGDNHHYNTRSAAQKLLDIPLYK